MMMAAPMARRPVQSGEMLSQLERHKIQVLLEAGHTMADVAQRCSASLDTVRRVQRESAVVHTDDARKHRERGIGRPSKAAPFAAKIISWLADDPELPTQELLRRAKDAGYTGRKTALYALVSATRPPRAAPVVRFEGLPGEFSQHDFGQVVVTFVDGRKKRIHFFASRLKYSRFARVTIVDNERTETIVRCLALVGQWIEQQFGVHYHPQHIPRLLHQLGFSVQRPRKRLARADLKKQAAWLRTSFPAVKKRPLPAAALSSSKTKPASGSMGHSTRRGVA